MNMGNLKLTLCALAILLGGVIFNGIVLYSLPFVISFFPMIDSTSMITDICGLLYTIIGLGFFVLIVRKFYCVQRKSILNKQFVFALLISLCLFIGLMFCCGYTGSRICYRWEKTAGKETVYEYSKGGLRHGYVNRYWKPLFGYSDRMLGVAQDENGNTLFIGRTEVGYGHTHCPSFHVQVYDRDFVLQREILIPEIKIKGDGLGYNELMTIIQDRLRADNIYFRFEAI